MALPIQSWDCYENALVCPGLEAGGELVPEAADLGDAAAQRPLGLLREWQWSEPRLESGFQLVSQECGQGHAKGQFGLGFCYAYAWSVQLEQAVSWFRKPLPRECSSPGFLGLVMQMETGDRRHIYGQEFLQLASDQGDESRQTWNG